jgi:hypothetical protein
MWNQGVKLSFNANSVGMGGGRISVKNLGMSLSITSIGAAIPG